MRVEEEKQEKCVSFYFQRQNQTLKRLDREILTYLIKRKKTKHADPLRPTLLATDRPNS